MKAECEHGLDTRLPCSDCQKAYDAENAPSLDTVESLVGCAQPHHTCRHCFVNRCYFDKPCAFQMKAPNAEAETSERSGDSSPATCSDFDRGVYFRSACSGLWYRCKESAGDIDAWKEDGVLHVIDESPND